MEHGSLAVKIRQEDYRPFLLTLYALVCYAADSGESLLAGRCVHSGQLSRGRVALGMVCGGEQCSAAYARAALAALLRGESPRRLQPAKGRAEALVRQRRADRPYRSARRALGRLRGRLRPAATATGMYGLRLRRGSAGRFIYTSIRQREGRRVPHRWGRLKIQPLYCRRGALPMAVALNWMCARKSCAGLGHCSVIRLIFSMEVWRSLQERS
jgi:hypothetical protein